MSERMRIIGRLPLLACPVCQSMAILRQIDRDKHVPRCTNCAHRLGWLPTREAATAAWNRRARPALMIQKRARQHLTLKRPNA